MQMLAELTTTERYKKLATDYIKKSLPELNYNEMFDEYYYSSTELYQTGSVTQEVNGYAFSSEMPFTFSGADVAIASPLLSNLTYIPQLTGDSDLKDGLLNAICADIENDNLPLNYRSNSEIIGYVVFSRFYSSGDEFGDNNIRCQGGTLLARDIIDPVKINEFGGEFKVFYPDRVSIPVYADMSNTVNFLKVNGFEGYLEEAAEISKIRIWVPDEQSIADENTYDGASMLWSGWWLNTDETCFLLPGNAVSITDKTEIEDVAKECTMMCLVCYETNYAEIIFEDGSRTFAAIPIR